METNESESAAHCRIGPSSLPARAVCPCHESAPGGADAQSGTRSHKVVEANICGAQGGPTPSDGYLPGTTEEEIGRGVWGARMVLELCAETAPGAKVQTETRTEYRGGNPAFAGKFGTVDAFWRSADGKALYIADYKTYASADGEKSYLPQGMMYAVLLDSGEPLCGKAERAEFFVVAAGNRAVARYSFTLAEARATCEAIISRVEAVANAERLGMGDEARTKCGKPSAWCRTCAHAAACPAISRAVTLVSGGGILQKPLAVRMAIIPVLESFAKRVKAEVKAILDKGGRVYDEASGIEYGYAERRGRARLADLRGLAEAVISYGVKPDDFAAAVSVSKTAMDGLLKAVDDANGSKVKKADREAVYRPYLTEPDTERYIKRIA